MRSTPNSRIKVAVVGVGHLGKHHARILAELPEVELVAVVDKRLAQAQAVATKLKCQACQDVDELPADLDAAVIAVPTTLHHTVAHHLLQRPVHLLIEKPLTHDVELANQIVAQAHAKRVILQVGHIERFNPACRAFKILDQHRPVHLIQCVREVPYSFRSTDIGAILDLMIHDIDLVLWITGEMPEAIQAAAWTHFGGHEDVAVATLHFPGGTVAQCLASRMSPHVRRELRVYAQHFDLYVDLLRGKASVMEATPLLDRDLALFRQPPPEQVASLRDHLFERYFARRELAWPSVLEPLRAELQHFVRCIRTGARPIVDGLAGRNAVAVAAAVLEHARNAALRVRPSTKAA